MVMMNASNESVSQISVLLNWHLLFEIFFTHNTSPHPSVGISRLEWLSVLGTSSIQSVSTSYNCFSTSPSGRKLLVDSVPVSWMIKYCCIGSTITGKGELLIFQSSHLVDNQKRFIQTNICNLAISYQFLLTILGWQGEKTVLINSIAHFFCFRYYISYEKKIQLNQDI